MPEFHSLDALVRARLREWPQQPPGIARSARTHWLRGRPGDTSGGVHPFLKLPGSKHLRTLPDGLYLNFGGTPEEPYVDIVAIEACSTVPNLLDKRSRFAPSTHSLLTVCPVPWLLGPTSRHDPTPRWLGTGVLRYPPVQPLVLPVRDVRVLYALTARHYQDFAESHLPHPHEFFMPMDKLVAEDATENPAVQALLARASASAQFLEGTPAP